MNTIKEKETRVVDKLATTEKVLSVAAEVGKIVAGITVLAFIFVKLNAIENKL